MATLKRNHTPKNKTCKCTGCANEASAPPGKYHRHCAKGKRVGKWEPVERT